MKIRDLPPIELPFHIAMQGMVLFVALWAGLAVMIARTCYRLYVNGTFGVVDTTMSIIGPLAVVFCLYYLALSLKATIAGLRIMILAKLS